MELFRQIKGNTFNEFLLQSIDIGISTKSIYGR
jgi:hypothetical protein